ncbi:MAG: DUF6484 domain-containing protein [Pseudomonadota bacterium]|nr:DUF6484 domain-containing protein [Pseudomonadota bacterium]
MKEAFSGALPETAAARETPSAAPPPRRIDGVVIGVLVGLRDAATPLVAFAGNPGEDGLAARSAAALGHDDIGRQVALLFEGGDPARPLVIGCIQRPETPPPAVAEVDGGRLVLTAEREIVLRCGKASITLTRDGKVLIRGAYLLSRSSGANRIRGGSVQIN